MRSRRCGLVLLFGLFTAVAMAGASSEYREVVEAKGWRVAFHDEGRTDWSEKWFLDGARATVRSTPAGLSFSAGPTEGDDAHHAVLWTQASFAGELKITFEYTRTDTATRNVNILYIQASGIGEPPFVHDIAAWKRLREVPAMRLYFNHMNALHVSFAAFPNQAGAAQVDYVRVRRYPATAQIPFRNTEVPPSYDDTGLFRPGETYAITVVKTDQRLFFHVNGSGATRLFTWDLAATPPLSKGRVGLRHMYTRSARYKDFTIYERAQPTASR